MAPLMEMTIALLLAGVALVSAALMMQRRAQMTIEARVDLVAKATQKRARAEALGAWLQVRSAQLDRRMRMLFAFGIRRTWGMKTGALVLVAVSAVAAAVVWALMRMAFGLSVALALPASLMAALLGPRAVLLREQRQAERDFTDLFPDALDSIVRMLRAGLPITSAVRSVGVEGAEPVKSIFAAIADQMDIGVPVEEALEASSAQIGLPDFRFFTVAVVLQRATGGNLAATLEILAEIMRKRRAVRLKARAATAEIRLSAYVLGALPFLAVGALLVVQPDYLTPLVADPRGHVILAMAAGSLLLALVTMRQMMRSVAES